MLSRNLTQLSIQDIKLPKKMVSFPDLAKRTQLSRGFQARQNAKFDNIGGTGLSIAAERSFRASGR